MADLTTGKPIQVESDVAGEGYIILPSAQVERLSAVLTSGNISHWVDSGRLSVNGGPYKTWVFISKGVDPARAQQVLDLVE